MLFTQRLKSNMKFELNIKAVVDRPLPTRLDICFKKVILRGQVEKTVFAHSYVCQKHITSELFTRLSSLSIYIYFLLSNSVCC